jgi:peptidoglycan/LPS O-acetylase OafA/YrhL
MVLATEPAESPTIVAEVTRAGSRLRGHVPELDGLRGIAILMVTAFHFSIVFAGATGPVRHLRTLLVPGWSGVDLFFALSGFLITGILIDTKGTVSFFRRFYIRRALRIFPVYYLALLVCFTFARKFVMGSYPGTTITLAYVFHLSNWLSLTSSEIPALKHFWSLAVEEQFYFCWPAAVFLLNRQNLVRLSVSLLVASPLLRYCFLASFPASEAARIAYALTPARMDTLAAGALIALAVRDPVSREWLVKYATRIMLLLSIVLCAWFLAKPYFRLDHALTAALLPSLLAAMYSLSVFQVVISRDTSGWVAQMLRFQWLQVAGRLSYAAYVIHFPLLIATMRLSTPLVTPWKPAIALLLFSGGIAATFLLAAISWNLLEKRILRYKMVLAP